MRTEEEIIEKNIELKKYASKMINAADKDKSWNYLGDIINVVNGRIKSLEWVIEK